MSKIVEQFPFMRDHLHKFAPALHADLHEVMTMAHEKGARDAMDLLEPQWNIPQLPPACSGEFVTLNNGEGVEPTVVHLEQPDDLYMNSLQGEPC